MKRALFAATFACLLLPLASPRDAHACGGAFFDTASTVHVTDHRMAIAISKDQTIIWDQIRYDGDPNAFAFVFPVPPGSQVELGDDAWLTALDAYTAPTIYSPREYSQSGCALMGCAGTENTTPGNASATGTGPTTARVVGPYVVSTVSPSNADELLSQLTKDGLNVPDGASAIVSSYLAQGMSFVVMRLRPGCGERSITPVRIVMPGSHPVVPLRLSSVGAVGTVNVEIFVLGTQRWAPQSYPEGAIDYAQLRADTGSNNYEDLADAVFASAGGRTFITEQAGRPSAVTVDQTDLRSTFISLCAQVPTGTGGSTTCPAEGVDASTLSDASDPFFDAAAVDASDNGATSEAGAADASDDAGADDAGDGSPMMFVVPRPLPPPDLTPSNNPPTTTSRTCGEPSDLTRVVTAIPYEQLYLTRLRAHIPVAQVALADLTLRPSTDGNLSQYHQALATPTGDVPRSNPEGACRAGGARERPRADLTAVLAALAFLGAVVLRRRARK